MATPTGFRDLTPNLSKKKEKLIEIIKKTYEKYGFTPLYTTTMEFMETLTKKSGEEIKDQIFKIEGEEIGLRFDLTVSLARFVSENKTLPKPFKRYAIGTVWRNEEPQRGRYREFTQADADVVGSSHPYVEVEVINMVDEIFNEINVKPQYFINDRRFLYSFAKEWENKEEIFRIIDKADKIGEENVLKIIKEKFPDKENEIRELFTLNLEDVETYSKEAYETLSFIIERTPASFSPYLVRGLDYYTGPIFEIRYKGLTISAGGRYDGFSTLYGGNYEPACGISIGVDRLLSTFEDKKEINEIVYVAPIQNAEDYAYEVANYLRKEGIKVSFGYGGRSLRKQLEYADSMEFPIIIIVGNKEKEKNIVTLKIMHDGTQLEISKEELPLKIKSILNNINEGG